MAGFWLSVLISVCLIFVWKPQSLMKLYCWVTTGTLAWWRQCAHWRCNQCLGTSESWQVRCRVDEKQHCQSIGDFPHVSLKEAREQVRLLQAAVIDGENPAYEKRKDVKAKSRTRQTLQISNLLELYEKLHLSQLRTGYLAKTFLRELQTTRFRREAVDIS